MHDTIFVGDLDGLRAGAEILLDVVLCDLNGHVVMERIISLNFS